MLKKNMYNKYCTGCGLCVSVEGIKYTYKEKGFLNPQIDTASVRFCEKYCPANGKVLDDISEDNIWGNVLECCAGWSNDSEIRYKASSGGILTSLCIFLLERRLVDRIIQIKTSSVSPIRTEICISKCKEDVIGCAGARYTISSPLIDMKKIFEDNLDYAFVGKPCDIYSLRKYCEDYNVNSIKYYLSFFCAALPSIDANIELLNKLQMDEDICEYLQYRGNGWPGFATAKAKDGLISCRMSYVDSWGGILGRDVNEFCRFCLDGIGLYADIVCGDAWYQDNTGKPDFNEQEGRNVIICRTFAGKMLVDAAKLDKFISCEDYSLEELSKIQQYQYTRRDTIYPKLLGMKIMNKIIPAYNLSKLKRFSLKINKMQRIRITLGTIKRILTGRIK